MASSVGFGAVAPAAASPSPAGRSLQGRRAARPRTARVVPAATKVATAAAKAEEKGLFDAIFGALYKEEQLLETDPILNKVEGKAARAPRKAAGKAAAEQSGGFSLGGLFYKKG